MEERSRDVIGLLEELTEQNRQQTASLKKQLFEWAWAHSKTEKT